MFEQHDIVKKMFRITVFMILTYIILTYSTNTEITDINKLKMLLYITLIFLIYELYYPRVTIMEKTND